MPAAAVIPAPIAYTNVVAVKKLVVGFLWGTRGRPSVVVASVVFCILSQLPLPFTWWCAGPTHLL